MQESSRVACEAVDQNEVLMGVTARPEYRKPSIEVRAEDLVLRLRRPRACPEGALLRHGRCPRFLPIEPIAPAAVAPEPPSTLGGISANCATG